jgi:iron complex outermembrane receptor protein
LQSLLPHLSAIVLGIGAGSPVASAQPGSGDTPPADAQPDDGNTTQAAQAEPLAGEIKASPSADTGTISGTIRSVDMDAPLSGATVTIVGTGITATTDDAGRFQLSAPPGRIVLRADVTGFRSVERPMTVTAGKTADVDLPMTLDQLLTEVVVVVGSRTPRTNVETTAPVDVVTAEEISHVGKTETGRVLSTLAPSYIATPQTIADGTDHVDPAALRGLGPDQVLVLVNGKRRHKSALLNVNGTYGRGTVGTDLNAIPVDSIKRIEVLRDGAASQYGSDAIAGVINIVTKDYTDLLDITSMTGETASRDGFQLKTGANYGFKIGRKGFLNITGDFLKKNPTNRSGQYNGFIFVPAPAASATPEQVAAARAADQAQLAMRGMTVDDFRMREGEAAEESAMGSYNLEIPIDDASTFYSFGDLGHRNGNAAGLNRFPNAVTQVVPSLHANGFLPEIHSDINDLEVTAGVKRKGEWTIDASITHGENSFQFNVENSNNASLGALSPTSFGAGMLSASQTLGDLDLQRKIDTGSLRSLAFVAGTEVRSESYKITPGDDASWEFGPGNDPTRAVTVMVNGKATPTVPGAQVFPGFQPGNAVDRGRTNVGVYAGLESEIVKGLNADIGGRYENYSDFGNSFTGKAAVRVPLGRALALRGAVSTGFRAPSLQQLWFNNTSTVFIADPVTGVFNPNQTLTLNNANPIVRNAFGIPELKQETSQNASAGLTFRPIDNLSITADGYFIRLKNRITLTNAFQTSLATSSDPAQAAAGMVIKQILAPYPGVTSTQFFANAVDTDTMGADIVGDYAINTGTGTLLFSSALNLTRTEVKAVHAPKQLSDTFAGVTPAVFASLYFDRLAQNRLEDSVPHVKGYASLRYTLKQLTAMVRADYYGQVRYRPVAVADGQTFSPKTLFDAELGYQVTKTVQLTVGGDNVFDTFPDRNLKANNTLNGRLVYNRNVSQFGMNGAFYFGKLELTFF